VEKIKQNAFVKKVGFNRIILVGVLLLMYLAFGAMTGGKFFGMSRIVITLNYVSF
jgi:ribose transport system permease protein